MKKLLNGILSFRANITDERREQFARLALGQSPDALLIACSDSRVAPNVFASTDPGDVFVTRNVGNIIPPHAEGPGFHAAVSAGVEFAVGVLNVKDIIVCGHSGCGAMHALHTGLDSVAGPAIKAWLWHAMAASNRLNGVVADLVPAERREDQLMIEQIGREWWKFGGNAGYSGEDRLSQINVLLQMEHVLTIPIVRDAVADKRVRVHGWWFEIGRAEICGWDREGMKFRPLDEAHVKQVKSRIGAVD